MGGGSGGHVTPVLAVIDELARRHPSVDIRFWCDRGFLPQSQAVMKRALVEVKVEKIIAGKVRRYHNIGFLKQLIDFPTVARNFFDLFLIVIGFAQSFFKLLMWRPSVVFCKGGFVCLPVGYAARLLGIPLVIHDSDAHPGLTNRLLARSARLIGTGAPLEYYNYPITKTHYVGIPVKPEFREQNAAEKAHVKHLFHLQSNKPLVVVTGGGLGAKRINDALVAIAPELIKHVSVFHLSGTRQYDELKNKLPTADNYKLKAFLSDHFAQLIGAADIVISRAGASAMAELAAAGACVMIVPNGQLTGGQQLKNAKIYLDAGAAELADELIFKDNPQLLLKQITDLLANGKKRHTLSSNLYKLAKPDAAQQMANLIEQAGKL